MRVLIIEDEKRLADTIADIIATQHYTVDIAYDGESGLDNALSGIYDAVITDIMLPSVNGYDILTHLRENGNFVPVLILSAKSEVEDRVKGLRLGADYYLSKPFENEELLACLKTILRRTGNYQDDVIIFGDITLNVSTYELSCRDKSIRLSTKEIDLLQILMMGQGKVIKKERLINKVWGYDSDADNNHVEVYMTFLRRKLSLLKSSVIISIVRSVGYYLEVKNDTQATD